MSRTYRFGDQVTVNVLQAGLPYRRVEDVGLIEWCVPDDGASVATGFGDVAGPDALADVIGRREGASVPAVLVAHVFPDHRAVRRGAVDCVVPGWRGGTGGAGYSDGMHVEAIIDRRTIAVSGAASHSGGRRAIEGCTSQPMQYTVEGEGKTCRFEGAVDVSAARSEHATELRQF